MLLSMCAVKVRVGVSGTVSSTHWSKLDLTFVSTNDICLNELVGPICMTYVNLKSSSPSSSTLRYQYLTLQMFHFHFT